ncbi:putative BZIP domain-containing protein [Seiridium cardinale]
MDQATADMERKRNRNRVAQQKYRKKIKSHIEGLEKQAAIAAQIMKGPESTDGSGNLPQFWPHQGLSGDSDQPEPTWASLFNTGHPVSMDMSGHPMASSAAAVATKTYPTEKHRVQMHYCSTAPSNLSPPSSSRSPPCSCRDDVDFFNDFSVLNESSLGGDERDVSFHEKDGPGPRVDGQGAPDSTSVNARGGQVFDKTENRTQEGDQSLAPLTSRTNTGEAKASGRVSSSRGGRNHWSNSAKPPSPPGTAAGGPQSIEGRVECVLSCIQAAGFDNLDAFVSCYYTEKFEDRSKVKAAQGASRSQGLPKILEDLRVQASSWSLWEAYPYRDGIIKSAADLIISELDRLSRKKFDCEEELRQNMARSPKSAAQSGEDGHMRQLDHAAELKETLRDELPNLTALLTVITDEESTAVSSVQAKLLLATLKVMAADEDEPVQEAEGWVRSRAR